MNIYTIPDSFVVDSLNYKLLYLRKKKPHLFSDSSYIQIAYGCPGKCIWNGGRITNEHNAPIEEWRKKIRIYSHFGVQYRLTFTNLLMEKQHLDDYVGNSLAEELNETGGHVMVATQVMADYMREKYPNLKISWSTTTDFAPTMEETIDVINKLSADSVVVLPYEFNNDEEQLKKFIHPENLEVLVNERCLSHCPQRKKHEKQLSKCVLYGGKELRCLNEEFYKWGRRKHNVRLKHLELYNELGINRFKIVGRTEYNQTWRAYLYYLINGTYRREATQFLEFGNAEVSSYINNEILHEAGGVEL